MSILLSLSLAMIIGLLMTRVMKQFGLPNVTAYIIAGLLVGPFCFSLIPKEYIESLQIINTAALGFIAFSIGCEFRLDSLRMLGKKVLVITVMQAVVTTVLVDIVLLVMGVDTALAITMGAIAAATAPAATLMVVRQYKAKGPVTETLLPVVAGDDAVALILFSLSVAIAQSLASGTPLTFTTAVLVPLWEIVLSLLVGGVAGVLLALSMRIFRSRANRLSLIIALVFGLVSLAEVWTMSALLLCMTLGAVYVNMYRETDLLLDNFDRWTPPLFLLFFVISGADLDLTMIAKVGVVGIAYLITRSVGKYFGAGISAHMVNAHPSIKKYLGLALLPQAGVAIGMAQVTMTALPMYGIQIRTIVLAATLIYELVGPIITKQALIKAGEIILPDKKKKVKA